MESCRVALITGGSSGIGAACVRSFLALGWAASVVALPGPELDPIEESGALVTSGDITSPGVRQDVVERTLQRYGRIDALINNAGVGLYARPTEVSLSEFSRILEVNVLAPLALAQMVIPYMQQQGSGSIVNIGSVAGFVALPWAAAYSASKFALNAMHDSLRRELRGSPIQVIKICPGIVKTDFRNNTLGGSAPHAVKRIRWVVSPDTVAARIVRAIEEGHRAVYVPRIGRVFALLGALAPSLMDLYLSRYFADSASAVPPARMRTEKELALSGSLGAADK